MECLASNLKPFSQPLHCCFMSTCSHTNQHIIKDFISEILSHSQTGFELVTTSLRIVESIVPEVLFVAKFLLNYILFKKRFHVNQFFRGQVLNRSFSLARPNYDMAYNLEASRHRALA